MKTILFTVLTFALPFTASASRYSNHISYGEVLRVEPVYQNISIPEQRQVCDRGTERYPQHRKKQKVGSAVIGGIIGGAIGNKFGRGHGRDASTALGVLIGASIGANKHSSNYRSSCYEETYYHHEEQMVGYDVTYRYQGVLYQTQTQNHPGDRIRLRVNVDVID